MLLHSELHAMRVPHMLHSCTHGELHTCTSVSCTQRAHLKNYAPAYLVSYAQCAYRTSYALTHVVSCTKREHLRSCASVYLVSYAQCAHWTSYTSAYLVSCVPIYLVRYAQCAHLSSCVQQMHQMSSIPRT